VYKQRHDGDVAHYIYRLGQFWNVGDKLGEASKHLRAPVQAEGNSQQSLHSEELPPAKGWQYNDRFVNVWSDDSTMELGVPSPPCRTVLVELTGEAAKKRGSWAGRYTATGDKWNRGREVLQHESGAEKNLTVATTGSAWRIYSTIDERLGWIESSSAGSSCPASPAAAISKRLGRKNWQYWDGSLWGSAWHEGGVTVTCDTPGLCL